MLKDPSYFFQLKYVLYKQFLKTVLTLPAELFFPPPQSRARFKRIPYRISLKIKNNKNTVVGQKFT